MCVICVIEYGNSEFSMEALMDFLLNQIWIEFDIDKYEDGRRTVEILILEMYVFGRANWIDHRVRNLQRLLDCNG